jgi:hypothetical protein
MIRKNTCTSGANLNRPKETKMFTVLSNTRNASLYIITALAIMVVVLLTFAVVPSIAAPKPAIIPATGSQNAYVEFLRGEKVMYANPDRLSEALSTYRTGEKADYANAVDSSSALSAYRLGEKAIYPNTTDLGNALSAWHFSEKRIYANADLSWPPRPDFSYLRARNAANVLESALLTYRQGEKAVK